MTIKNSIRQLPETKVGNILIAKPFWNDETYKRSVILIISHNEEGSTGVMLNKMSNLSVHDALPELDHHLPLYFGGRVNKKIISYVHGNPNIPDAYHLGNDLFWGGNYEALKKMHAARQVNLQGFLFCAGFVQWTPGEIETELAEEKWWMSKLTCNDFYSMPLDELWWRKLLAEEHVYGLLAPYPDPSLS